MIVAVSASGETLDAAVDPRFGRCAYFLFLDSDTGQILEVQENEARSAPGGAGPRAAKTVVDGKAAAILTGNVGPKAFDVLADCGVRAFTGASGTVKDALAAYLRGDLREATAATSPGRSRP